MPELLNEVDPISQGAIRRMEMGVFVPALGTSRRNWADLWSPQSLFSSRLSSPRSGSWYWIVAGRRTPTTWGDIHVNTPKVYTRERLVNDRFRQQA